MEKQWVSDDFGGCEAYITFQNGGNPQKTSSRARISSNFRVPGTSEVGKREPKRAPILIGGMAGVVISEARGCPKYLTS